MERSSRFEQLVRPHLAAAFNLAFWLVRSRSDAEDIVQEALLRAFRSFGGFEGNAIRPWFFAIVRNTAYSWLGSHQLSAEVVSLEEADIPLDEPSAEDRMVQEADRELLLECLARLPPIFREILVLREIEGLGYREIGEITGVASGTVMSRLSRGRNELRKLLLQKIGDGQVNAVR